MDHGWAPYRQIGDMNMPGAYMFEHWALLVVRPVHRPGLAAGGISPCCAALACRHDLAISTKVRLAGSRACVRGRFILTHAAEGPQNAGQREQVMAVLMIAGTALLFEGVRRRRSLASSVWVWPVHGAGGIGQAHGDLLRSAGARDGGWAAATNGSHRCAAMCWPHCGGVRSWRV